MDGHYHKQETGMRYFDRQFIKAELDDSEYDRRLKDFHKEMGIISQKVDLPLSILIDKIWFHDSVLFESIANDNKCVLKFVIWIDSEKCGYKLAVDFFNASYVHSYCLPTPVEILYHEFSLTKEGKKRFSLINADCQEMHIDFDSVCFSLSPSDYEEYFSLLLKSKKDKNKGD
jgi:hypothetical protein